MGKPIRSWVRVATGTGAGTAWDTHGLPMPFPIPGTAKSCQFHPIAIAMLKSVWVSILSLSLSPSKNSWDGWQSCFSSFSSTASSGVIWTWTGLELGLDNQRTSSKVRLWVGWFKSCHWTSLLKFHSQFAGLATTMGHTGRAGEEMRLENVAWVSTTVGMPYPLWTWGCWFNVQRRLLTIQCLWFKEKN